MALKKTETSDDLGGKRKLSDMTVREAVAITTAINHGWNSGRGSSAKVDAIYNHAVKTIKDAATCAMQDYLPPPPQCKDVKWE